MGQLVIPSGSKVYVDTSVIIYTLEENINYFDLLKPLPCSLSSGSILPSFARKYLTIKVRNSSKE